MGTWERCSTGARTVTGARFTLRALLPSSCRQTGATHGGLHPGRCWQLQLLGGREDGDAQLVQAVYGIQSQEEVLPCQWQGVEGVAGRVLSWS